MPTYTVTDPQSGVTLKLTGDSPPTEAELNQIFAQHAGAKPPASSAPQPGILDRIGNAAQSAYNFAYNTGAQAYNHPLDTAVDAARSIPGGLAQGLAAVGGVGGDIREAFASHLPKPVHDAVTAVGRMMPAPFGGGYTSAELNQAASAPTGGYYQPTTNAGRITETAASFAPAALGGEGSLGARLLSRALVPATGAVAGGDIATDAGGNKAVGQLVGTLAASANPVRLASGLLKTADSGLTIAGLKAAASAAYDTVDKSGMIIDKKALASSVSDLTDKMAKLGIDADATPNAFKALNRLKEATNENQTFQGMNILRKVVSNFVGKAAGPDSKQDRMMARVIQDHLDDFVGNLQPSQVLGGVVDKNAISALNTARDLWSRTSKAQLVEDTVAKAVNNAKSMKGNFGPLGIGDATQTAFRQLTNNARAMARFTKPEQDALRRIAQGGLPQNILRVIGKLSPDQVIPLISEINTGVIGLLLGHNPALAAGALGAAGLGVAGKAGAQAITSRNVRLAKELMLRGPKSGPAPSPGLMQSLGQIDPKKLATMLAPGAIAYQNQQQGRP